MKTICLYSLLALLPLAPVAADEVKRLPGGAAVDGVEIKKQRDSVVIRMNLDLTGMEVGRNRSIVLAPVFRTEDEKQWLPAIEVMGRTRYLYYERNEESLYTDNPYAVVRRKQDTEQRVDYRVTVPYRRWMNRAELFWVKTLVAVARWPKATAYLWRRPIWHLSPALPMSARRRKRARHVR